jgi:ABC-type cobalamin/Fe3+-siderophores transport system ATPase subunit
MHYQQRESSMKTYLATITALVEPGRYAVVRTFSTPDARKAYRNARNLARLYGRTALAGFVMFQIDRMSGGQRKFVLIENMKHRGIADE